MIPHSYAYAYSFCLALYYVYVNVKCIDDGETCMQRGLRSRIFLSLMTVMLLFDASIVAPAALPPLHAHAAASFPSLGTAASFAVLGAATVTNTGPTMLTGDLGVSPGPSCTGFPAPCTGGPGTVTGTIHVADAVAAQAQTDATSAYQLAAAQPCTTTYPPITDIGGMTLTPGVYCFPSSAGVTGTLTLDAQTNPNAVFIFEIGSTLITASASKVVLINGAQPSNVFWQVGSSATLGTTTSFAGSIVALTSITATTAATSSCGLYALNGAVTLDSNSIQVCPVNPGVLTLVNDTSATMTGPPLTLSDSLATVAFHFTSSVSDHRGSGAGWELQASSSGLSNGSTNVAISLTANDPTSTCTNGTCSATTFTPISLTTVPSTFLQAGSTSGTVVVDGDYSNIIDGYITVPAGTPAGIYLGTIRITLVNTI
jgi:hypothetical protein